MAAMWSVVSLWLWSAAAAPGVPREDVERLRAMWPSQHVIAMVAPTRVGIVRLPSQHARGRWTPTTGVRSSVVVPALFAGTPYTRSAAGHDVPIRPRRLVFRYDATAPPLSL
jgi:hypothetical protein